MQLGFAKAHHQFTLEKVDVSLGYGSSPKCGAFPLIFLQRLKLAAFKFGTWLGFARAHHKITPEEKVGWPWARGAPKNFGFPYNIFATAGASDFKFRALVGFAKAYHKITRRRNGGRGSGLGELPKI